MPYTGKMLNATVVRQLFFCVLPIAPTGKVSARLNVDMTSNTGGKLMNHLRHFYRLKNNKGVGAICAAHGNFHGATKTGTDGKRPSAVRHFGKMIKFRAAL